MDSSAAESGPAEGEIMSKISSDCRIDPRLQAAFGAMPDAPNPGDVPDRRALLAEYASEQVRRAFASQSAAFDAMDDETVAPSTGLTVTTEAFASAAGGHEIRLQVIRPDTREPLPCVYYIHGGAMQFWSCFDGMYRAWGRLMAAQGVAVVMVDFRNALLPSSVPEVAPYPAGLDDCVEGLCWVREHATRLGIDRERIVVAGDSGGGNLTLALGMKLLREGDAGWLGGLYAMCPYIGGQWPNPQHPSSTDNDGILLELHNNRGAMAYGIEALQERDPLAWPGFASDADVRGLPPTVILVDECDPLRDEGIAFYRLLLRNGVPARCRQSMGTIHGAEIFAAVCPDISRDAARDIAAFATSAGNPRPAARPHRPIAAATFGFRATMTARAGEGDALVELLLGATTGTGPATNPKCVLYLVERSPSDRDVVHVTEGWTSKAAHAANFARAESQALVARLAGMVVGEARYEDVVTAGGHVQVGGGR